LHGRSTVAALKRPFAGVDVVPGAAVLHGRSTVAALKRFRRGFGGLAGFVLHGRSTVAALKHDGRAGAGRGARRRSPRSIARGRIEAYPARVTSYPWEGVLHGRSTVAALKRQCRACELFEVALFSTVDRPWPH